MDVATVGLMLALLGIALVFFWLDRVPADLVALGLLLTLVLTGLLPADLAFAGFSSDTVMTMLGLLVMTSALMRTGTVDIVGRAIIRLAGSEPRRLLGSVMTASATLSAFISNTASTAFFLPTVLGVARRAQVSPARLLMPLAFASILTSSVTLISTSTNLVVSGLMTQSGLEPLTMFELAPVGIPIAVAGLIYMFFIGSRMVPDRLAGAAEDGAAAKLRPYLTELVILEGSKLAGNTLEAAGLGRDLRVTALAVERDGKRRLLPPGSYVLAEGDVLLVEGEPGDLATVAADKGIDVRHQPSPGEAETPAKPIADSDIRLAEAVIMPGSQLVGRRLRHLDMRARFGVQILAIQREGQPLFRGLADERLRVGDMLLVQGEPLNVRGLAEAEALRVIDEGGEARPNLRRARIAVVTFALALGSATAGIMSFPVAMLLGALTVMVTRCITPDEAWREVHWRSIVLIACMLGVGVAMETTGTATFLATGLAELTGESSRLVLMSGFFALTVLLTQPLSNQAAAAIVVPVAIGLANALGQDPRPYAIMICVAASCSFITPLEPSCLMVQGPGGYRFSDFIKVGTPLTILIWVIAILIVPWWWSG